MDTDTSASICSRSIHCIGCAYSLTGLRDDGKCPECGSPIARTLEHLERAVDNEKLLREMLLGLDTIKIAYAIAAADIALVVLASIIRIDHLSQFVFFVAAMSSLVIAGALISGHIAMCTPVPDAYGHTPRIHHGRIIGSGMLTLFLGPLALFLGTVGIPMPILMPVVFIACIGAALSILIGMAMLSKAIERRTAPSAWLHASRIAAFGALSLSAAAACACTLVAFGVFSWNFLGLLNALLGTAAAGYCAAHLALTIALARSIRKSIGRSPPPSPPAPL